MDMDGFNVCVLLCDLWFVLFRDMYVLWICTTWRCVYFVNMRSLMICVFGDNYAFVMLFLRIVFTMCMHSILVCMGYIYLCARCLQPQSVDPILKKCFGHFLKTLQDPDLNVRRVALVTFNSAGHNKPSLIRDMLTGVLPYLYNETKVRVCCVCGVSRPAGCWLQMVWLVLCLYEALVSLCLLCFVSVCGSGITVCYVLCQCALQVSLSTMFCVSVGFRYHYLLCFVLMWGSGITVCYVLCQCGV